MFYDKQIVTQLSGTGITDKVLLIAFLYSLSVVQIHKILVWIRILRLAEEN
jgi:hypothetical protein